MPLSNTSPDYKNFLLQRNGYDASQYDLSDDGIITPKPTPEQPNTLPDLSPAPTQDINSIQSSGPQPKQTSAGGALLHSAEASAAPTAAGLGAAALTNAMMPWIVGSLGGAPETGGGSLLGLVVPMGMAIGASLGISHLQQPLLSDNFKQQLAAEQEQHPLASTIGGILPSTLAFDPFEGAMNVVPNAKNLGTLFTRGVKSLMPEEIASLRNMGINMGIQGGQDVYGQLKSGQPFNYGQLGLNLLSGATLNEPWGVGKLMFPTPKSTVKEQPGIDETQGPLAKVTQGPQLPNPDALMLNSPAIQLPDYQPSSDDIEQQQQQSIQAAQQNEQQQNANETFEQSIPQLGNDLSVDNNSAVRMEQQKDALQSIIDTKDETIARKAQAQAAITELQKNIDLATGSYSSVVPAETAVQKAVNNTTRYQEEPNDDLYLYRNASNEYKQAVNNLAARRGISLQEAMGIINPATGNEVLGEYNNRVAQVNPNRAQLDTPVHEIGHGYMEDLAGSSDKSDRDLYAAGLNIFGGDARMADEALAGKLGVEGVPRIDEQLHGSALMKFNSWFKDFVSRWKYNLGVSSDEDVIRHLSARQFHDAPYGTRPELLKYTGFQPGFGSMAGSRLWTATDDIKDKEGNLLVKNGSTVSENTLNKLGIDTRNKYQDKSSMLKPTPSAYNDLSPEDKLAYAKLHTDALEARINHEKNFTDESSDNLIDKEVALKKFEQDKMGAKFQSEPSEDLPQQRGHLYLKTPYALKEEKGLSQVGKVSAKDLTGRLENMANKGIIPRAELDIYKKQGLESYLNSEPRSIDDVSKWMQKNGPQIETLTSDAVNKIAPEIAERNNLMHSLVDSHPDYDSMRMFLNARKSLARADIDANADVSGNAYPRTNARANADALSYASAKSYADADATGDADIDYDNYYKILKEARNANDYRTEAKKIHDEIEAKINNNEPKFIQKWGPQFGRLIELNKYIDAHPELNPNPNTTLNTYQNLSAKESPVKTIMLRVPQAAGDKALYEHHHFGNLDRNVVGWSRVQYEDTPTKGKVAFINEAQSDWGQAIRNFKSGKGTSPVEEHELLHDYNRLILKATIDQARKDGATGIVISDAKTALMSEGIDKVAANVVKVPVESFGNGIRGGILSAQSTLAATYGPDWQSGKYAEFRGRTYRVDKPEFNWHGGEQIARELQPFAETGGKYMPQETKFKLLYDKVLPKIAQELTGVKGESINLGEHKRAFDNGQPRNDLLIKNPDGTVKTDATGVYYPIEDTSRGEFSMLGKYQEHPSSELGLPKLSKKSSKTPSDKEEGEDYIQFPLTRSANDTLLKTEGPHALPLVKAINDNANERDQLISKYTRQYKDATSGLSQPNIQNVERTLLAESRDKQFYRDKLPSPQQQESYDKLRDFMHGVQVDRIEANQPVKSIKSGVTTYREAGIDPHYWPNQMSPKAIEELHKGNTPMAQALRDDFTTFKMARGVSRTDSNKQLEAIVGSYSKIVPNMAHFRGMDVEQGQGLPYSFMRPGLDRNMERYINRVATARAYHDTIESNPEVARLIGETKDPWGNDLPNSDIKPLQSGIAKDIVGRLKGQDYDPEEGTLHAASRVAASSVLGWQTSLHIAASTVINGLSYAKPSEIAGMAWHMVSDYRKAASHALEMGTIKEPRQWFKDLFDAHATQAERLNSIASGLSRFNGRNAINYFAKAMAQAGGEYLAGTRPQLANAGDKQSIRFMKSIDDSWVPGKTYSEQDKKLMGANFSNLLHGIHDSRTQPNWMLKDNIIQPFTSLMSWNIAQTNTFMKYVLTPLIKDHNVTPLIMSTLGAVLGGAVIKEAREKLADKKMPIPAFNEIAAAPGGLEAHPGLVAYNLAVMSSFAGYAGILSLGARSLFDLRYKNPVQGLPFPLDETLSSSFGTLSDATSALMNAHDMNEYKLIGTHAIVDLFRDNVQAARIAMSWADDNGMLGKQRETIKHLQTEEGDLRRFKMAEGLPYNEQVAGEDNPYYQMNRKMFQRNMNVGEDMQALPGLIRQSLDESGGNIEVFKQKLQALKDSQYPSMPSIQHTPILFTKYLQYLQKTQGPQAAADRMHEYILNNAIDRMKGAIVPAF